MLKRNGVMSAVVAIFLIGSAQMATAGAADGSSKAPRATVKLTELALDTSISKNSDSDIAQNVNTAASAPASADAGSDATEPADADASASAVSVAGAGGASGSGGDDSAASGAAPIFLSSGDDTCMGSGGIGAQGIDFGVSISSSWTDSNCVMLKNARELKNQGHDKAAKARLCMNDDNALAFELAGEPCPRALASTQAALAKIRSWDPDYQVADGAVHGAQFASLDGAAVGGAGESGAATAESQDVAYAGGGIGSGEEAGWLTPKIDSIVAVLVSVADTFASGIEDDPHFWGHPGDVTQFDGPE